ncbi:hypothetical protein D5H75_35240 [Bailinhaonella thermotolerans]|uniref:Uncharacterized protein n=1 Tax=Bailinhaonella thermotolerans TaxID=1070861 RepID=A0A3A4A455_9ACTN|nr:hypothetical protein D5H75_35240 [Bailinhaonella thermotolerans]
MKISGTIKVTGSTSQDVPMTQDPAAQGAAVEAGQPITLPAMKGNFSPQTAGQYPLAPGDFVVTLTVSGAPQTITCKPSGTVQPLVTVDASGTGTGTGTGTPTNGSTNGTTTTPTTDVPTPTPTPSDTQTEESQVKVSPSGPAPAGGGGLSDQFPLTALMVVWGVAMVMAVAALGVWWWARRDADA